MARYECPRCKQITVLDHTLGRGETGVCGNATCRHRINRTHLSYQDPQRHLSLIHKGTQRPQQPAHVNRVINRSSSAPPVTMVATLTATPPAGTQYCASLGAAAWTGGTGKIRLAYKCLDPLTLTMNGLVINPAGVDNTDGQLKLHFDAIAAFMTANRKIADATEGTGEAAAAWGVGAHYPGYRMIWGFHKHSGAGIDQIWKRQVNGVTSDYLIVEAKGVGQILSHDTFQPGSVGQQLSRAWVIDRLSRMSDALGAKILQRTGLTSFIQWPNYGGLSKSYYGATHTPANQTVHLHVVVGTAKWMATGRFGCDLSGAQTYF